MIIPSSQIVGLIEIETLSGAGSDCLVALGCEEESLGELLVWLTGQIASRVVGNESKETGPGANRLSGLLAAPQADCLPADLTQLQSDLAQEAAQFRLRLTAGGIAADPRV
jgi:hypothetical protein